MEKGIYQVALEIANLKEYQRFAIEFKYETAGSLMNVEISFFDLKCDSYLFTSTEQATEGLNGLLTFLKTQY